MTDKTAQWTLIGVLQAVPDPGCTWTGVVNHVRDPDQ
jgi:hypothetical protein